MRRCATCQAPVPRGSQFCPWCGGALPAPTKRRVAPLALVVFGTCVMLAAIVAPRLGGGSARVVWTYRNYMRLDGIMRNTGSEPLPPARVMVAGHLAHVSGGFYMGESTYEAEAEIPSLPPGGSRSFVVLAVAPNGAMGTLDYTDARVIDEKTGAEIPCSFAVAP